ncbi:MotA/TolQ/ExbB proton channel family protein [Govanella unica]|uniref:MotA/TolQ/ExbB proton channel family protein n=1 Tax=Govanella unica TaxID=2975056 RepID=A0A9X3TYD2_9PROT|nr:MotA/TolQ/ExbB proton channel family protein [Govania unica]MDA5194009.1 MotA/TolQ/ExbB proton channel family protein [Govania unica]
MADAQTLSLTGLFLQADMVVKAVMILLALASLASWSIIFEKLRRFRSLRRATLRLEKAAADPVRGLDDVSDPVAAPILAAGKREVFDRSEDDESRYEFRERLERAMRSVMATELRKFEIGLPFLATVGSVAPFIGLFGTVWGIMNSFSAIASANNTSLSVVAPGIAEALFATAIGLFAAIPAVIGYNNLVVDLGRSAARMTSSIGDIGNRLSRRSALRNFDVTNEAKA